MNFIEQANYLNSFVFGIKLLNFNESSWLSILDSILSGTVFKYVNIFVSSFFIFNMRHNHLSDPQFNPNINRPTHPINIMK